MRSTEKQTQGAQVESQSSPSTCLSPSPQKEKSAVISIAYIPISNQHEAKFVRLDDNEHFDFTELPQLNAENFQASVELQYPLLAEAHPLVLSGFIRRYNKKTYLDFILKGPFSEWQGQISGVDQQAVLNQLQLHLFIS